jgi:hypothetical protein
MQVPAADLSQPHRRSSGSLRRARPESACWSGDAPEIELIGRGVVKVTRRRGAVGCVDQLHGDPQTVAGSPDAPLENRSHAELRSDRSDVGRLSLEEENGRARDHLKPLDPGEGGDHLFGEAVAENLIGRQSRQVLERENGQRALCSRRERPALDERPRLPPFVEFRRVSEHRTQSSVSVAADRQPFVPFPPLCGAHRDVQVSRDLFPRHQPFGLRRFVH